MPRKARRFRTVMMAALAAASAVMAAPTELSRVYRFDEPEVTVSGGRARVRVKGLDAHREIGCPLVPVRNARLLIPAGAEVVSVQVEELGARPLRGRYVLEHGERPFPLSRPETARPTPRNEAVYASAELYPSAALQRAGVHRKHGYAVLALRLYPVRYRPADGGLVFAPRLRVRVKLAEREDGLRRAGRGPQLRRKRDRANVAALVDNPEQAAAYAPAESQDGGVTADADPEAYLHVIVTTDSLRDTAPPNNLQALNAHRVQRGMSSTLVTREWIEGGFTGDDLQEKLRAFIQYAYTTWGTRYVLLAGAASELPPRMLQCEAFDGGPVDLIPGDLYYACLDGTFDGDDDGLYGEVDDGVDLLAEVAVGRALVDSADDVRNFVRKTLAYEHAADAYLSRVSMAGEYLGFGGVSEYAKPMLEQVRLGGSNDTYFTTGFVNSRYVSLFNTTRNLYDTDRVWSPDDMIRLINEGVHVINHLGHANNDYNLKLTTADLPRLSNTHYGFVYSQGCMAGWFDESGSFAEELTSMASGAFATVMNARFGWGARDSTDGPSHRFNRQFWDVALGEDPEDGFFEFGWMNQYSKERWVAQISEPCMRWCTYELNLFGDPATAFATLSGLGVIELDRTAYRSDASMHITVTDGNYTNDTLPVTITCYSNDFVSVEQPGTKRSEVDINLPRTTMTGVYTGLVALAAVLTPPPQEGDWIVVSYLDEAASGNEGVEQLVYAWARIDDTPPRIWGGFVRDIDEAGGEVVWYTDEPSDSFVAYGETPPPPNTNVWLGSVELLGYEPGATSVVHAVSLDGLAPLTTYCVALRSTDAAGNTAYAPTNLASTVTDDYVCFSTMTRLPVFFDDMESGPRRWTHAGEDDWWELGVPRYGPPGAYSGLNCWGTNLDGNHGIDINAYLMTPPIFVGTWPRLTFRHWHRFASGFRAWVEVDAGNGWINVTPLNDNGSGYFITGSSDGWEEMVVDMRAFQNRTVRIRFRLTWYLPSRRVPAPGWYIDDVRVTELTDPGVWLTGIVLPVDDHTSYAPANDGDGYAEPGETVQLTFRAINADTQAHVNVTGHVDSPTAGATITPGSADIAYGNLQRGEAKLSLQTVILSLAADPSALPARIPLLHTTRAEGGYRWDDVAYLDVGTRAGVSGRVTNTLGAGVVGATLTGFAPGQPIVTAQSGVDGVYALQGMVPGSNYTVTATSPGAYLPDETTLTAGAVLTRDFLLRRAYAEPDPASFAFSLAPGDTAVQTLRLSNTNALADTDARCRLHAGLDVEWLDVTFSTGTGLVTIAQGTYVDVEIRVAAGPAAEGTYEGAVVVENVDGSGFVADGDVDIPLSVTVAGPGIPYIELMDVAVEDGDADGYAEPGETLTLTPRIRNIGTADAVGVTGWVSSATASVTVPQVDFVSPIAWGVETAAVSSAEAVVPAGATNGQALAFELAVEDAAGRAWTNAFEVPVRVVRSVSGHVRDNLAVGLENAGVSTMTDGVRVSATTDALGAYRLAGLGSGVYTVYVDRVSGYAAAPPRVVTVGATDVTGIDFTLGPLSLGFAPQAISEVVEEGRDVTVPLAITNQGPADAVVAPLAEVVETPPPTSAPAPVTAAARPPVNWAALRPEQLAGNRLIVRYEAGTRMAAVRTACEALGARVVRQYRLVPACVVEVEDATPLATAAAGLEAVEGVVYAEPSLRVAGDEQLSEPRLEPNDYYYGLQRQWSMDNEGQVNGTIGADIDAPEAWRLQQGSRDVIVAVIDTGISYTHEDLAPNMWVNPGEATGDANDDGFPGVQGVDDDGDADSAAHRYEVPDNGVDDDGDGLIDENGIDFLDEDVMRADYNTNGVRLVGLDGLLGTNEVTGVCDDDFGDYALARFDDDENGFYDDIHGADWYNNDGDPMDDNGHGTHVAGTIGARGNNTIGVAGVTWNVQLMALKFLGWYGGGSTEDAIAATEYAILKGARILNNSWGGFGYSGVLHDMYGVAAASNMLVVCSAGNGGWNNDALPHYPASDPAENVVSVTATDRDGLMPSFANTGAETVDLAAPGVDVFSTYPGWLPGGTYAPLSGTSMAAPHVAGVAALLWSASPDATWEMVKAAILQGAVRDDSLAGKMTAEGYLNAFFALGRLGAFWIGFDPAALTLAPSAAGVINVELNKMHTARAGIYTGNILLDPEAPPADRIPVTLAVVPAPVPVFASAVIDDAVTGDGDGVAEPGEQVELDILLYNRGSAVLLACTGVLTTSDPNVSISGTAAWAGAGSDEVAAPTQSPTVTFGPGAGPTAAFVLTVDDGTHAPWTNLAFSVSVRPSYSVTGQVRDRVALTGVGGASVQFFGTRAGTVLTDGNGFYRIDGLGDGRVSVRALKAGMERSPWQDAVVSGGDVAADFLLGRPAGALDPSELSVPVAELSTGQGSVEALNLVGDSAWQSTVYELAQADVALISDGTRLAGVESVVEAMGARVTRLDENLVYGYTWDTGVMTEYDIVIADLTGLDGTGRKVTLEETVAMQAYVATGGKLLLTGGNLLGSPDNQYLGSLAGSSSVGVQTLQADTGVAATFPDILDGPFCRVEPGETLGVSGRRYDDVTPDPGADATGVLTAGSGSKILHRDLLLGEVMLWTGNDAGAEWLQAGVLQDLFKNLLFYWMAEDVPWMAAPGTLTVAGGGTETLTVALDATVPDLPVGTYEAVLLLAGNLPDRPDRALPVSLAVVPPALTVEASVGVRDWLNRPLSGNGDSQSAIFQVLWTGPDGEIDPPLRDGTATGDDTLLVSILESTSLGRFGTGYEGFPDFGRFRDAFHLGPTPVNGWIYVRAWDAESFAESVAYGDSPRYKVRRTVNEQVDFLSWTVNRVIDYPGGDLADQADYDGDTIPDGYAVKNGLEARWTITPLPPSHTMDAQMGVFGGLVGQFNYPGGITVGSNTVFVSDTYNHRIQVLNRSLSAVTHTYGSYGTGQGNFYEPEGVIFDPGTSRLIVADRRNYRVVILDWDAVRNRLTFNRAFGAEGVAAGEFRSAYGVATGPLGRIHVADSLNQGLCNHRIQIFSGEGVFSREFGEFGATAGKFDRPLGVAVDASGLVYVADAANARIQCLSGSGGYLWQTGAYGTANGQFREPRDVRFGIRGRLYVTDTSNSRLQVFDLTTFASPRHLASYGEVGSEPGQLRFPQACAPALDDNVVYVADTRNHRVQALRTILDDDGDGMDDLWEDLNGLDSRDGDDADDDPDGDGLSNIGEYRLGTDPQDEDTNGNGVTDGREAAAGNDPAAPAIALRISAMEIAPDELSWQAHAGQAYRVMYGTSLTEPDWVEHGVVTSAVDGVYTWTNSVMPGDRMYFYRIDEVQE